MLELILAATMMAAERPPNVVLILADDLGWGEVGCQGQEHIPTPNIDRVASEGMRLTNHWSGSAVCAPSRCVLLTGKHPGHAVVRNNWEAGGWGPDETEGQYPLPDSEITLAERLKASGYATCGVGKWGLGGPDTEGHPNNQGFDHWFGYLCQRVAHNYYPTHLWRNDQRVDLEGNDWFSAHQKISAPLDDEAEYARRYNSGTYASDLMRDEALAFIDEHADEPFFLYYASPIPHVAIQVPVERLDAFPREWDSEHYLGQKGYVPHPRPRAGYAAMIATLDDEIGAILERLRRHGVADDTIVIITSDNGPTYAGGVDHEFFDSNGPLRGLKGSLWEGGLCVPTVVRWPGHITPGSRSHVLSGFEDLAPTICAAIGRPIQAGEVVDGVSLVPTLTGEGEQMPHDYLYRELGGQQAVKFGKWKAVRRGLRKGDLSMQLFDLENDPGETTDVASEHPPVALKAQRLLDEAHEPSEVFPLPTIDAPVKKN